MHRKPASLYTTVRTGKTLRTLEVMRDHIAADIEACDDLHNKPPLYLRLTDILARIDALRPADKKGDAVDEITARRSARRAGPAPRQARAQS